MALNPRYTFARFVVGPSNDAAVASASAVAVAPGRAYNPLFLYGDTGLGKTHLMQAVAHAVLARRPAARVEYVSAESFTNDLVAAVQQGAASVFHERFARSELLLVDDVHVLAGRAAAQAAFAEVFRVLYESGRQIMLTSDRAPHSLGLDAVLVGQFKWGKVVDVSRPDAAHRLAIVRSKLDAESLGATVSDEVAAFVAEHVRTNVRALEGAIVRVVAHAAVRHAVVTVALAGEALRVERPVAPTTLVERAVAVEWAGGAAHLGGLSPESLHSKRRTRALVEPRQVAMYLCREVLRMTLHDIGTTFGGRDHSTVIHAVERVKARLEREPAFAARVERVASAIKSTGSIA
ncbi:MAG TPA: chromosomal replication initiator protein DnaA [Gemmatimonadaceae bacterium]|nr:chromosomal replication initiator protein DnaA [Gemmatimonadaceae bacterium]